MELISREALIEKLEEYIEYDTFDLYKEEPLISLGFEQLEDIICSQPTVETKEVVHGEWKEATPKGVHSWSKWYARCSACDETIWSGWEMNFCPKCGCDMRTSAE